MLEWQRAVKRDPDLNQGESLPRAELFDHIPALLRAFEERLRHTVDPVDRAAEPAAAHGLQRWQQGYDLREVSGPPDRAASDTTHHPGLSIAIAAKLPTASVHSAVSSIGLIRRLPTRADAPSHSCGRWQASNKP